MTAWSASWPRNSTREGVIELLGITVVAGNEWLPQEVADALKAVERLGITSVGVYAGARYPLVHDYRNSSRKSDVGRRRLLVQAAGARRRRTDRPLRRFRGHDPGATSSTR